MTKKMRRDSIDDVFDQMQDMFKEFQLRGRDLTTRDTPVDIHEEDDKIVIKADIPGVQKEDISLKADDTTLEIHAESEQEIREENEKYVRRERSARSFRRKVSWPTKIDPESIEASYQDGVLTVTAEKDEDTGRDIEIE